MDPNVEGTLANLTGKLEKRVRDTADNTTIANGERDKKKVHYAIVPQGPCCGYCIMLASRGPVYLSKDSALRAKHTNCDCSVMAVFSDNQVIDGYNLEHYKNVYNKCRSTIDYKIKDPQNPNRMISMLEYEWRNMSIDEKGKYGKKTRNGKDAYNDYVNKRVVQEMNTRDRQWLYDGTEPEICYIEGAKPLKKELDAAKELKRNGFKIYFRNTRSNAGLRTSDMLIGGKIPWEIKQPIGDGKQTIYHQFEEAAGQAHKLIIDCTLIGGSWNKDIIREEVIKLLNYHYKIRQGLRRGKKWEYDEVILLFNDKSINRII